MTPYINVKAMAAAIEGEYFQGLVVSAMLSTEER
jgi:hypothetical protein